MSNPAVCCFPKHLQTSASPTVFPQDLFLVSEDAEDLWNALHAAATDYQAIINILPKRTLSQRLEIVDEYKKLHAADLVEDLTNKLSGDIKNVIVAMMTPLRQYYASELHYAIAGLGTDENILIEVLCTLSNKEIKAVKHAYNKKYSVNLEDDIAGDTSGQFKSLLVSLCKIERDESMEPDQQAAYADAQALQNSTGDARWTAFSDILTHRSYAQLRLIFTEYEQLAGNDIEKTIKKVFSGDVRNALLAIVGSVKNPAAFFAKQLNKSMAGLGTNDRDLVRVVVTRSEVDMADIKREYEAQIKRTLATDIIDDTSGDYKKCLLILIGEEAQTLSAVKK